MADTRIEASVYTGWPVLAAHWRELEERATELHRFDPANTVKITCAEALMLLRYRQAFHTVFPAERDHVLRLMGVVKEDTDHA